MEPEAHGSAERRDPTLAFRDTDPEIELPDRLPTEPPPTMRKNHDTLPSARVPAITEFAGADPDASAVELRIRVQADGGGATRSGDVLEAVLQSLRRHGWKPTFVAMGPPPPGFGNR